MLYQYYERYLAESPAAEIGTPKPSRQRIGSGI
jgi:hypothetical protein